MLRDFVEHIRDGTPGSHGVHRDLLMSTVLCHDAHERLDSALRARIQRVLWHTEGVGCVGRHKDDAAAVVEVAVGFASDEELGARIDAEDTVEFFLLTNSH